jgi:hypothetical protein
MAAEVATMWAVYWRYRGTLRLIDFEDRDDAFAFAKRLEESEDREQVQVLREPMPELDDATKALITARIKAAVRGKALMESHGDGRS